MAPKVIMGHPARTSPTSARLMAVQSPIIPVVADWIRARPGTISLGQGVVSYGPPPQCQTRLNDFYLDPENHKYKPVQGLPALLELLSGKLSAENQIPFSSDNAILVTAGSNMGFMNALLAVADPGDEVILQVPYYFNHEMAVTIAGCRPVLVPTDDQCQLQPDRIREALSRRTRAVVTISPNNPSGAVYSEQALREVNQLCADRGLYHIHDQAYENFIYDGARAFSPGSIPGSEPHTISLFSLSKAYGFASWRIGYMVVPSVLMDALRKIQDTILICPPVISQFAAIGALEAGSAYCRERMREVSAVRAIVLDALRDLGAWCQIPRADGAFYFLPRFNASCDPLELARRLIQDYGVAVIPGGAFGLDRGCVLRVAYGALSADTAREGIGRLTQGLRDLAQP